MASPTEDAGQARGNNHGDTQHQGDPPGCTENPLQRRAGVSAGPNRLSGDALQPHDCGAATKYSTVAGESCDRSLISTGTETVHQLGADIVYVIVRCRRVGTRTVSSTGSCRHWQESRQGSIPSKVHRTSRRTISAASPAPARTPPVVRRTWCENQSWGAWECALSSKMPCAP